MQKRENPYTPGAGRKPPNLAGRDRDLENFQSLISRVDFAVPWFAEYLRDNRPLSTSMASKVRSLDSG
jgi:hypothetical protein